MAFKRYDPKTKELIMKAATEARAAGKTWVEAHDAAKAVGYKGSSAGLDVMIRNAKQKKAGKAKQKLAPAANSAPTSTKPAPKKPLGALRYDPKAKEAIAEAANKARSRGKTWVAAHAAAKEAGYKGSVQGLVKMIQASKKKGSKAKVAAQKVTKPTTSSKVIRAEAYDPVRAMIDQIVKEKVKAVVENAIAELRKAVE